MYVNPFEKMKKIREEKERQERETIEEKKRFAKLGAQLGFRDNSKYSFEDYEEAVKNHEGTDHRFAILPEKAQEIYQNPNNFYSQNIYEEYNEPEDEDEVYEEIQETDNQFFYVNEDALEKIDAILNSGKEIPRNLSDIETIQKSIFDYNSQAQYFSLFGDIKATEEIVLEMERSSPTSIVKIDMKKIFSYNSPYLYILKKIINAFRVVTVQDKNAIWERIVLFLSSTSYGRNEMTQEEIEIIDNSVDLFDPIELSKNEFKNLIDAYKLNEKLIVFNFRDFRSLTFEEVKGATLFVYELFEGIKNIKFLFEVSEEFFSSDNSSDSFKSWITFFDLVYVDTIKPQSVEYSNNFQFEDNVNVDSDHVLEKNNDYNFQENIENIQKMNFGNNFTNTGIKSRPPKSNVGDIEIDLREINFIGGESNPPNTNRFNSGNTNEKPIDDNDYADYRTDKDIIGQPLRIKITDTLEKAKREEMEREIFLEQQKMNQGTDARIDQRVLIKDSYTEYNPNGEVDLSKNFNVEGYRSGGKTNNYNSIYEQANKVQGLRSYDKTLDSEDKLNQMRRGLEESSHILIKGQGHDINTKNNQTFKIKKSNLEVPNSWEKIK